MSLTGPPFLVLRILNLRIGKAGSAPVTAFGRRCRSTSRSNACPGGTHSVRPRQRRASGSRFFRLLTPRGTPSAAKKGRLRCLRATTGLQSGDSTVRYSHADWERKQQVEPTQASYVPFHRLRHYYYPAAGPDRRLFNVFSLAPALLLFGH